MEKPHCLTHPITREIVWPRLPVSVGRNPVGTQNIGQVLPNGYLQLVLNLRRFELFFVTQNIYGCETWSLTLRKERRLRVFRNRVLRRIFGPSWDEVTGQWRKLHNEELNDLYSSPNIFRVIKSRRMRWAGHVAGTGDRRGVYRVLVGNSDGKRPLGRARSSWEENIKMDLQEVGCGVWTGSSWLRIGTGGGHL